MKVTKKHPPLIQLILDIQKQYPEAIIATEIGNFYEIMGIIDDGQIVGFAKEASIVLDAFLTRKNKSDPNSPYMCGFPIHSAEGHFTKLTNAGYTVVVVEQAIKGTKADKNKSIPRKITKILTPGTNIDKNNKNNIFFASLYKENNESIVGISLVDLTTGQVQITEILDNEVNDFIQRYEPKEILISGNLTLDNRITERTLIHYNNLQKVVTKVNQATVILEHIYKESYLNMNEDSFLNYLGIVQWRYGALSLANFVNYLSEIEYYQILLKKIAKPETIHLGSSLILDSNAYYSLNVFSYKESTEQSLLSILDNCATAMGSRLLRKWLLNPTSDLEILNDRYKKIDYFMQNINIDEYTNNLKQIYDLHRINRRLNLGKLNPHELLHLVYSIKYGVLTIEKEDNVLKKQMIKLLDQLLNIFDLDLISENVLEDFLYIKTSALSKELITDRKKIDLLKNDIENFKKELECLIQNVKIKLVEKNNELCLVATKGSIKKLEELSGQYELKYTLTASDIEIKDINLNTMGNWIDLSNTYLDSKILYEKKMQLEFEQIQQKIFLQFGEELYYFAEYLAEYDVLLNFAKISKTRNYVKPKIKKDNNEYMSFKNIRHPIVELNTNLKEPFVGNDISFDRQKNIMVIYGANSSGKSTLLKSVALNVIMAQIGCFIPAKEGFFTVFDSIQTRISSNDNISNGMSTFVVEMTELTNALHYIDKNTLLILDEIGRGTSANDGESIGYATLSYLATHPNNKSFILFATHYHNLYEKIIKYKNIMVKNFKTEIIDQKLFFKRKLEDGPGDGSYGFMVAKSCGIPETIIRIAEKYSQDFFPLKTSRYNKNKFGILCEICKKNPVQETNHKIEQSQSLDSKIKDINGIEISVHDKTNLEMICSNCHRKITNKANSVRGKK